MAYARQLAIWLARRMNPEMSNSEIGRGMGFGRNYTAVWHAVQTIDNFRAVYPDIRKQSDELLATLHGSCPTCGRAFEKTT